MHGIIVYIDENNIFYHNQKKKRTMGHIAHLSSRFQYVPKTVTDELSYMKGSLIVCSPLCSVLMLKHYYL